MTNIKKRGGIGKRGEINYKAEQKDFIGNNALSRKSHSPHYVAIFT